jgi:hypothetical protein
MKKVIIEEGTGELAVTVRLSELDIAELAILRFKERLRGEAERIAHGSYPKDCPRDCPKIVAVVDKVYVHLTPKVEEWEDWYSQVMSDAEEMALKEKSKAFEKIWAPTPQEKPAEKETPVKKSAKKRQAKKNGEKGAKQNERSI